MPRPARPYDDDRFDRPAPAGGLPLRAVELAMRHPLTTGAVALSVVMIGVIFGNALGNQPAKHPHPFFATRTATEAERTAATPQTPAAAATPASAAAPIALPRPKPTSLLEQPQMMQELQVALRDRGYYSGPVDGVLGPATTEAIKAFERRLGATPTGEPNEILLGALRNIAALADGTTTGSLPVQAQPQPQRLAAAAPVHPVAAAPVHPVAAVPARSPAAVKPVATVPAATPARLAMADAVGFPVGADDVNAVEVEGPVVTGAIRRAAREPLAPGGDERLQKIQRALIAAGYGPIKADGRWDEKSQAAVRRYEADHGWTQTGKASDKLVYGLLLDGTRPRR